MHRLLIVDDEPHILSALRRTLAGRNTTGKEAWQIETFEQPQLALRRAQECTFDLVLSDFRMPEMNGVEFLTRMRAVQPDTIRIILSGHTDLEALLGAINDAQIFRFISKPWADYDLKVAISQALQHRDLQVENQRLADIIRVERGKLSHHEAELRRLERESPGITQVKWSEDGAVIFEDFTEEDLQQMEQLLHPK